MLGMLLDGADLKSCPGACATPALGSFSHNPANLWMEERNGVRISLLEEQRALGWELGDFWEWQEAAWDELGL